MNRKSGKKRKINHGGVSEPAVKNQKLFEDPIEITALPPELWLEIFDYLKPKERYAKELSVVCKQFRNILSSRLRVLHLDFDKILASDRKYPVIKRAYSEIRMTGKDIDCHREKIKKVLESSRDSARKLFISVSNARSAKRCKIKIRTLMFIMSCLPILEEVELVKVDGLAPQLSFEAFKLEEAPEVSSLKKLTMTDVTAVTSTAFKGAKNIEELKAKLAFKSNVDRNLFRKIVTSQKELKVLHNRGKIWNFNQEVFMNNLKLQHIETSPDAYWGDSLSATYLSPLADLKTLVVHGSFENFDPDKMRANFPSLKSVKAGNVDWSA